ncbi:MAG: HAD hydrolase family protein, partial [Candidatus Omnitrophota bacterium]
DRRKRTSPKSRAPVRERCLPRDDVYSLAAMLIDVRTINTLIPKTGLEGFLAILEKYQALAESKESGDDLIVKLIKELEREAARLHKPKQRKRKAKNLSRGKVSQRKDTHPALERAANEGSMFALTKDQLSNISVKRSAGRLAIRLNGIELNDEKLADQLLQNLLPGYPSGTRTKLLQKLQDPIFRENIINGLMLMYDAVKNRPIPPDTRLCLIVEDKDKPTIIFKDSENNLIAHSGEGKDTGIGRASIYAGYNTIATAIRTSQEKGLKEIIRHEANDIIKGHRNERLRAGNKLYDDVVSNAVNARIAEDFEFVREEVPGQDKKHVRGRANRLWFSDDMIADFNKRGIFVFDIDKTIAARDRKLLDDMVQTIQNLMRNGHLVVIITGQPINVQRERIVDPIAKELRQNLVVMTNEGAVVHHFLNDKDASEYIVTNGFTEQWNYSNEELSTLKDIVEEFVDERGIEYAPGQDGPPDNRENVQLAFKIEASILTRLKYAKEIVKKYAEKGLKGFQCTISGSTTVSLWKEGIAKNTSGLGFLRDSGFEVSDMAYYGDEFFEFGNDLCMLDEKDLLIFAVGRYNPILEGNKNAVYIGAGPYATQLVLDNFVERAAEQIIDNPEGYDFRALIRETAMRQTDWETLNQSYQKRYKRPRRRLEAIRGSWVLEGTRFETLLDRLLEDPVKSGGLSRLSTPEAIAKLSIFHQILREYRVGSSFVDTLYKASFGNALKKDYEMMAKELRKLLPPEEIPPGWAEKYKKSRVNVQALRDILYPLGSVLEEFLGRNATGQLRKSIELLTGQEVSWAQNTQSRKTTRATTLGNIESVANALDAMLDPKGAFPWMLRVLGGDLSFFHKHINITLKPSDYFLSDLDQDNPLQGLGGMVGFGGGGGSRMMGNVLLETMLQQIMLSDMKDMPFTMITPSEDDGGSTFFVVCLVLAMLGVKLPAMGDIANAMSGLTLGKPNVFNEPHFQFIFNIFRSRFPTEG